MKKTDKHTFSKKNSKLDESTLTPKAKVLLEELSTELNLSKEVVAELAVLMYRMYKDKV